MEIIEETRNQSKRFIINNKYVLTNNNIHYHINKQLGYGSYANIYNIVFSENDYKHATSPRCIKIFKSSDKYSECGKIEIAIMKKLKKPNLFVSFFDSFIHNNHFCIISTKYDYSLYDCSKKKILCNNDIKIISKQLLKGLIYLKKNKIIHGDLKPENILVDMREHITACVISDFNLSTDTSRIKTVRTDTNISSLWYRAPEIYLAMDYSFEIDIWAFGCILYELIAEKSLFNPKTTQKIVINNKQLYEQHISFLGVCPYKTLDNFGILDTTHKISFDSKIFKTGFQTVFSECIKWDPTKRMLPGSCLKYIREMM
jgi:serine/threonine protein kinase